MRNAPFNTAVIGYGLSAKVFHIPFIQAVPAFKLHGIVQRSPKPDNDAGKDFPGVKIYKSAEEAYADGDVAVIVITSIPETHFPMAKAALEAGKNVIVEKPFVPTSGEAEQLIEDARKSGKLLSVYQNRRYDSDYNTVAKVMRVDKALGDLAEFETHFDRHRPDPPASTWKTSDAPGTGALFDLGSHLIDQVYHLFGLPQKSQASSAINGEASAVDPRTHAPCYCTTLGSKAGVMSCEAEQLRFWVRGTKGSFKKFHLDVQEDQLKAGLRPGDDSYGVDPEEHYGTLTTTVDGKPKRETYPTVEAPTYVGYYRDFAAALEGKREVPVSAEDARDVLRIIEAAIRSSKEERTITL